MKRVFELLAFTVFLCVSFACQREPLQEEQNGPEEGWFLTFTAESGEDAATKTSLAEDGSSILWSVGDKISVFCGAGFGGKFTSTNEEPVARAEFEGNLTAFSGAVEGGIGANPFWAVYPYSEENTVEGDGVITTLPASQTAVAETFMNGALLSVARSENLGLAFYNVCGGVKFSVTQSGIQQVVFRGNNGEILAGRVFVKMNAEGRPEVTKVEESQTSIRLTAPKGTCFEPGKMYYLVCLPVELTQGFTLTLMSETKTGVYEHPDPVSVKRAVFGRLSDVDATVTYADADNHIYPGPPDNEIWYTTANGEVCGPVSNAFNNGSGTTTEVVDCFGANLISNTYQGGKGMMVFDGPVRFISEDSWLSSPFNVSGDSRDEQLTEIWLPDGVTEIPYAFSGCVTLQEVHLPEGLRSIGPFAFDRCVSLESIKIPDSVTSIDRYAFSRCSALQEIVFSSGLTSVGDSAFEECDDLKEITLPESLVNIGARAFVSCRLLKEITIPSNVASIGELAFDDCESLYKVQNLSPNVEFEGNPFGGAMALSEFTGIYASSNHRSLVKDGKLIAVASAGLLEYDVPEDVNVIGSSAFWCATSLGTIRIPDNVVEIGTGAFSVCRSLTSIILPSTITSIEDNMFSGCSSLQWITIPESVTRIGDGAFGGCSSLKLKNTWNNALPQSLTSIGDGAFSGCSSITEVVLPASLTSIGAEAFRGCPLTEVTIPASVTNIFGGAFASCEKLTTVRFEGTEVDFKEGGSGSFAVLNPFMNCPVLAEFQGEIASSDHKSIVQDGVLIAALLDSMNHYEIPEGITTIGGGAFEGIATLTEITIPEGVKTIGNRAFSGCSLMTVTLPSSITSIGGHLFNQDLESVILKAAVPPTCCNNNGSICFQGRFPIYVPAAALETYQADPAWAFLGDRLQAMPVDDGGHEMVNYENW